MPHITASTHWLTSGLNQTVPLLLLSAVLVGMGIWLSRRSSRLLASLIVMVAIVVGLYAATMIPVKTSVSIEYGPVVPATSAKPATNPPATFFGPGNGRSADHPSNTDRPPTTDHPPNGDAPPPGWTPANRDMAATVQP